MKKESKSGSKRGWRAGIKASDVAACERIARGVRGIEKGMLLRGKRDTRDAIHIGEALAKAKRLIGHGKYEKFLKDECGYCSRQALRYRRLYEESRKRPGLTDLPLCQALEKIGVIRYPDKVSSESTSAGIDASPLSQQDAKNLRDQLRNIPDPNPELGPGGEASAVDPEFHPKGIGRLPKLPVIKVIAGLSDSSLYAALSQAASKVNKEVSAKNIGKTDSFVVLVERKES